MRPIYFALSVLDIIAGLAVLFSNNIFFLGLIILLKALYSLSLSLSKRYLFDWMGWTDLITGSILIFSLDLPWFGILTIIKGAYSLVWSLG